MESRENQLINHRGNKYILMVMNKTHLFFQNHLLLCGRKFSKNIKILPQLSMIRDRAQYFTKALLK